EPAVVEDPPPRAHGRLRRERVRQAEAGSEGLVVVLLRVVRAVAGGAEARPREGQPARTAAGPGVGAARVEEREPVVLLAGWSEVVPAQAVVHGQLAGHLPGVADVQDIGRLAGIGGAHCSEVHVPTVDSSQQAARDGAAAVLAADGGGGAAG